MSGIGLPFLSPFGNAARLAPAPNITTCGKAVASGLENKAFMETALLD